MAEDQFERLDFAWGVDSVQVVLNLVDEELFLDQGGQVFGDEDVPAFGGVVFGEIGGVVEEGLGELVEGEWGEDIAALEGGVDGDDL